MWVILYKIYKMSEKKTNYSITTENEITNTKYILDNVP